MTRDQAAANCPAICRRAAAMAGRAIGQAFGANHFDIGDAEEAQHGAQVAFVGRAGRLAGMHATGGGDDHHFLVAGQPTGPFSV